MNSIETNSEKDIIRESHIDAMRNAILKAIEEEDMEAASELIDYWETKSQMEDDGRLIFYHIKLQLFLKCYELAKDVDAKIEFLHNAIETGNKFFALNESRGFPMDSEVKEMWYILIDASAMLIASYSEGCCEEDYEGAEFDEMDEDYSIDLISEAIWARIGRINRPNLKPKPPRKYDDSLKSRLLKAVDFQIEEYGGLDDKDFNLLKNLCQTLDIDFEDFLNCI